jgi:isopentenyl-diphosphate delta-isomerase
VVLLNDDGASIGTAEKGGVHHGDTPLHLAFSCYVFDPAGSRVLVTRRALTKRTWPGVWTNSFCGHPQPLENVTDAVERRASDELGMALTGIRLVLPDFRYRAIDASGVVENEICPVYIATAASDPFAAPEEVMDLAWAGPADLTTAARATPSSRPNSRPDGRPDRMETSDGRSTQPHSFSNGSPDDHRQADPERGR